VVPAERLYVGTGKKGSRGVKEIEEIKEIKEIKERRRGGERCGAAAAK